MRGCFSNSAVRKKLRTTGGFCMARCELFAGSGAVPGCMPLRRLMKSRWPFACHGEGDDSISSRRTAMLGWMIVFALLAILNAAFIFLGHPADASPRLATAIFSVLFLLGLLTRAVRGRAW